MPYALVLDKLIKDSGMSVKEIANKCNIEGEKITAAYISVLRNEENNRTPSDEVSKTLEKVLGAKDNALVIEAYMDNAPEIFKKAIYNFQKNILYGFLISTNQINITDNSEQLEALIEAEIKRRPLYSVITSLAKDTTAAKYKNLPIQSEIIENGETYSINLNALQSFLVNDNSMYPTIPEHSSVTVQVQEQYKNGDIVAFYEKEKQNILYRQLTMANENTIILTAYNKDYIPLFYDSNKITIIGKVTSVITAL